MRLTLWERRKMKNDTYVQKHIYGVYVQTNGTHLLSLVYTSSSRAEYQTLDLLTSSEFKHSSTQATQENLNEQ